LFIPDCKYELKLIVGMAFDSLEAVEEFYKTYAHKVRFVVCIGPQIKVLDQIENKRFYCTRQGFMRTRV
jgi:hypothetical protein